MRHEEIPRTEGDGLFSLREVARVFATELTQRRLRSKADHLHGYKPGQFSTMQHDGYLPVRFSYHNYSHGLEIKVLSNVDVDADEELAAVMGWSDGDAPRLDYVRASVTHYGPYGQIQRTFNSATPGQNQMQLREILMH